MANELSRPTYGSDLAVWVMSQMGIPSVVDAVCQVR